MNILLLGNGFDIAHHLPSTYTEFFQLCEEVKKDFIIKPHNKEMRKICSEQNKIREGLLGKPVTNKNLIQRITYSVIIVFRKRYIKYIHKNKWNNIDFSIEV